MDYEMTEAEVMHERMTLIQRAHSRGLTAIESARLAFLNAEALRLCPRVTPEMQVALDAERERMAANVREIVRLTSDDL